jgi:hypothetical protein
MENNPILQNPNRRSATLSRSERPADASPIDALTETGIVPRKWRQEKDMARQKNNHISKA